MNTFRIKKSYNTFFKKEFLKKTFCFQEHVGYSFSSKLYFGKKAKSRSFFIVSNFSPTSNKKHKLFSLLSGKQNLSVLLSNKTNSPAPVFFNFSFDKNRLKNVVAWFLEKYGQYKTIQLLENLKEFGFGYATKAGLSLGIDDLKIPNKKIALLSKAETKVSKDLMDYRNSKITGIERTQRLIYIWNQTNDMLKQEVIKYFETMDLFNPIYMMAFSGARGNMSQVRQLVGMRGLMSDPQGQIIDFPIQSNFREGLTLTEYLISTYGARKGIVDTALRTATAGYLTRRLVDVAQHIIVSQFDCKTSRGIFLFDMKEANKTIYSFQNRLVGRVLAQDIFSTKNEFSHHSMSTNYTASPSSSPSPKGKGKEWAYPSVSFPVSGMRASTEKTLIASRNQEVDSKLAFAISKVTKKAFVRSPLTCETPRLVCQLCYGWSLSQGKLVSVGEAVGVIAAQSIGEPGTQLTMRTFHTGGVFAGGLTDQILAPFDGKIQYFHNIPGSCVRISLSEIAFFTKMPGSFFVIRDFAGTKGASVLQKKESYDLTFSPYSDHTYLLQVQNDWKNKNSSFSELYKIPAYSVLFMRNHEYVQKKQVLAQFSTVANKQFQYGSAEQTLYSALSGEFYLNTFIIPFKKKNEVKNVELIVETRNSDCFDRFSLEFKNDILWKFKDWTNIWILSGKVLYNSFDSKLFIQEGDFLKKTSVFYRILWKKTKNWNLIDYQKKIFHKQTKNRFYLIASEIHKNSQFSTFFNFISNTPFFVSELKSLNSTTIAIKSLSFVNVWTSSLQLIDLKKHNFLEKSVSVKTKLSLRKSNFIWKTGSNNFSFKNKPYSNQKYKEVFLKLQTNNTKKPDSLFFLNKSRIFQFLQLEPFSTNIVNFHKKQNFKHKKFFNPKKDIVFSGTFQKYFIFSSRKKLYANIKTPFPIETIEQQKPYTGIDSKQKKVLKQIFFKFSTSGQTSPFFQVYNFAKKFNLSQKFIKFEPFQKQNYSFGQNGLRLANKKKNWNSIFLLSKKELNFDSKNLTNPFFFAKMQKRIKQDPKIISVFSNKYSTANKSLFSFIFDKKVFNSQNLKASKKFFLHNFRGLSSCHHVTQNTSQGTDDSQQIGFKKILLGFQYNKVRYKKFGYVFSFSEGSKNNLSQHSLRTFTTLKHAALVGIRDSENPKVNPGKKQKGIFVGNENFFGKDFPRFLSFCFPKNYQTFTNGIFNILIFENSSKNQKFTQFLCFKEKSFFFDFLAKDKFVNNQKTAFGKNRKKVFTNNKNFFYFENPQFQQKNITFLVPNTFDAVQKKNTSLLTERTAFYASHPFADFTNLFQYSCKKNFHLQKQKHFFKNFSFCLKKNKTSQLLMHSVKEPPTAKELSSFVFYGLETLQNNKIFNKVNNSQIYTEEIFWLPQENYTFSILDIDQVVKKNFSVESFENSEKLSVPLTPPTIKGFFNTESYVSNQILKKTPFFYSSNGQGKKKAYFSMFEGIWNWSFSNKGKYQNLSISASNTINKIGLTKKRVIEQKISFYKDRNQKQLLTSNMFCTPLEIGKGPQAQKHQILTSPFFSIKRHKKRKIVQKLYLQKKLSFKFFLYKFFFKNFYKRIYMKNSSFFQQKKRKFFKRVSKVYFANKINKKLTKNFMCEFQNKKSFAKQKLKKLFTIKVQNSKFLPLIKIQKKVGQFMNSHCFTCLPYQNVDNSILFSKNSLKNQFKEQDKMSLLNNKNFPVSFQKFKPSVLQHQQIHIKIKSGWICFFPNTSFVANWHQSIENPGHFFGKDLCFEQNKILREIVILNSLSISFYMNEQATKQVCRNGKKVQKKFYSNLQPFGLQHKSFAKNPDNKVSFSFDVDTQAIEKNNSFSIESVKRNLNCRFLNDVTSYAIENFSFACSASESANIASYPSLKNLISVPHKTTLALFIRPMQYKLVENPKNYKSLFLNATMQNPSLQKNSISFVSSLKIYKKYHSNILNCQKSENIFLHNIKNVDAVIRSAFEKMHYHIKYKQNSEFSRISFLKNYTNQFKKNLSFSNFGLSKKNTIKKFSFFELKSKKFFISKFQNLLHRSISTNPLRANAKNKAPALQHTVTWDDTSTFIPTSKGSRSIPPIPIPFGEGEGDGLRSFPKGLRSFPKGLRSAGEGTHHLTQHRTALNPFKISNVSMQVSHQALSASFVSTVKNFSIAQQNLSNNAFQKNYFISFHPIQFLPLSVSHSSWSNSDFGFKTSQPHALLFFNPINMTIDFSICESKAAFLNQRVLSKNIFKKYVQTSSFWLNKDGLNFVVPSIVSENTSQQFWKISSFSKNLQYFIEAQKNSKINSLTVHTKKNRPNINIKVKNKNSKTKIQIYKTFVFKNSQSFYANTKIFSPFQGELISMHMNETNWWKKASEISTIQKLNNLFSVVRKQDLFAIDFSNPESKKAKRKNCMLTHASISTPFCSVTHPKKDAFVPHPPLENLSIVQQNGNTKSVLLQKDENNAPIRVKYDLKNKQKYLMKLYQFILKTEQPVLFVHSPKKSEYMNQISSFITKYENKFYKLKNLKIGYPLLSKNPSLGKFLVYGDCLDNFAIRKPGQIVHLSCFKVTLRRGQPFLVSPNGILHLANTPFIQKNVPILTLPYQTVQSGDIVQGIPKVEQLFEARTTIQGRLFLSSLPILLKGIFERYKSMLPLEQAVRQSFLKIQQLIVDGVQRVYRSQGVSIVDKHLEVIVRQMTTKVQIIHGAQTGFFPGELVNLNLVERINKFLLVKIRYEPVVLGITRASLEVESFLSASSFQQTTKILSLAAISRKKDFLKGLKENILVGNLIPSGTGYMVLRKNA